MMCKNKLENFCLKKKYIRFNITPSLNFNLVRCFALSNNDSQPKAKKSNFEFSPLSKAQLAYLDRIIRVDQAGELGAVYIYSGQYRGLSKKNQEIKEVLKEMWDQEKYHYHILNKLQVERRVRPSLLTPIWKAGAFSIGFFTALMGKEAAMACTVAVETVIVSHYNKQLRVLMNQFKTNVIDSETRKQIPEDEITPQMLESNEIYELKKILKKFRDDESEHLETGLDHNAEKAFLYKTLTFGIKKICECAIWTAERI